MDARLAEDGIVIATFVRGIISEVFVVVVTVLMIASEVAVSVSCATVVRAGVMIEALEGTVNIVVFIGGITVLSCLDANISMWAATTTALGCMPMLTSSEEVSTFGWGACSC